MIELSEIEKRIKEKIKTSYLDVVDLRGGDHIQVIIVSPEFEKKSLVEQHKIIYDILSNEMKSNDIHALTLKTFSPSEWEKVKGTTTRGVGHEI